MRCSVCDPKETEPPVGNDELQMSCHNTQWMSKNANMHRLCQRGYVVAGRLSPPPSQANTFTMAGKHNTVPGDRYVFCKLDGQQQQCRISTTGSSFNRPARHKQTHSEALWTRTFPTKLDASKSKTVCPPSSIGIVLEQAQPCCSHIRLGDGAALQLARLKAGLARQAKLL